ncbi:unnamed protein product [Ectocarpus sp. 4 AP-2014]
MAQSIGTAVSLPSELQQQQQQQQQHGRSMRRRQLYNNIIRGFEHLLQRGSGCSEQQGYTDIDGRGAGYVVWMPRREQYQEHRKVWDGAGEQGLEGEGGNPLVLYGGGYDGLFKGGLEQVLGSCDSLSPPLRWIRIPLEILPPPMPRSSTAATPRIINRPTTTSFPRPALGKAEHHTTRSSASNLIRSPGASAGRQGEEKQEDGSRGVTAAPEGSRKVNRAAPNRGKRGREAEEPDANTSGKCKQPQKRGGVVGTAGTARFEQRCEEKGGRVGSGKRGARPSDEAATERGVRAVKNARLQRQREVLDLWWLTDPPAPKVSAEALRLRVATETVEILQMDTDDAPDVVCTIEASVCQGRPYLPGRLQRYPNVTTSSGPYRAVYSYRVPVSVSPPSQDERSPGAPAGSTGSMLSSPSPTACSSWRGDWGAGDDGSTARAGWVSVTDVKPSHWYNVRHRFSWRDGVPRDGLEGLEEVVTATRHVHTQAFFPPLTPPPRPYAVLGCSRQHPWPRQQPQSESRRPSKDHCGGRGGHEGLGFHLRLRWGVATRGPARPENRLCFSQEGSPQQEKTEYILQASVLEIPSSDGTKKAKVSSRINGGLAAPNPSLRSTWGKNLLSAGEHRGPQHGGGLNPESSRLIATWSPGGSVGGPSTTDANSNSSIEGELSDEPRWGPWTTISKTGKTRETVELPQAMESPSTRGAAEVPLGLRYRVGVRRRDRTQRAMFGEVLEVPRALLRRLYSIQDISVTRQPLPAPPRVQKAGRGPSVSRVGRERQDEGGALELDEAKSFLEAFEMAADGDSFPMRAAWELQNEFWQQNEIEVEYKTSLEIEARLTAEAESIQRTLGFPISVRFITGVIREVDATTGG